MIDKKPLQGAKCYLSGAIEHDQSSLNWRIEPTKYLKEHFEVNVFDPFEDPKQQWVPNLLKAREDKDYKKLSQIARNFVQKDLGTIDRSDFVIAYLPYKVCTTGTHHEIIMSNMLKKPTLLVSDQDDIGYLPLWYFGFIKIDFMFPNWEELYDYLESVNKGEQKHNTRWNFVYNQV